MSKYAIPIVGLDKSQLYRTSQLHHRLMFISFMALVGTHKGLAACEDWP